MGEYSGTRAEVRSPEQEMKLETRVGFSEDYRGGGGSGFNLEVEPIDFSNGVGVVTEWKTGVKHNAMDAGLSVCRATSGVL